MCNYIKGVYDDGMEKGIEKGIIGAVSILRGLFLSLGAWERLLKKS